MAIAQIGFAIGCTVGGGLIGAGIALLTSEGDKNFKKKSLGICLLAIGFINIALCTIMMILPNK